MDKYVLSLVTVMGFSILSFYLGCFKIKYQCERIGQRPLALPYFYGMCLGVWTFICGCSTLIMCHYLHIHLKLLPEFIAVLSLIVMGVGLFTLAPKFHARIHIEKIVNFALLIAAALAVLVTLTIFLTLLIESIHFFTLVPITEFLFGTTWSPPTSFGQSGEPIIGHYGVIPLLSGTILITIIAMLIAVPLGLLIAVYTAEYASPRRRKIIKPLIEMLAGVPTIIYGFFALIAVAPVLHHLGQMVGLPIASESALGAGLVMGVMIIPFISSLSDEALCSIPKTMRENSWALGATPSETILKVIIPAAIPGIASAILLAFSRAVGETMLVVMAAGLTAHLTLNPLDSVTTITVQIVALLTGDQEFNSPKTLSAFALGLLLFLCTLILNIIALRIMRWHREKYAS